VDIRAIKNVKKPDGSSGFGSPSAGDAIDEL
jgi:hypothetical protein